MRQALRPYQERAIADVRAALSRGKRRVLLVAPCGAGKTSISAEIIFGAMSKGSRAIFLAHRKELIDQCSRRLDEWDVPHGVVQATHPRWAPHLPVQVASVQTLSNRLKSGALGADARLIIIDESHRALAPTYQEIVSAHEGAAVVGLTATPVRQDGRGLGALYDELVLVAQPGELVAQGFLVEPTVFVGDDPDLRGVGSRNGDFLPEQLAEAMDKPKLVGDVVTNFMRHVGRGRRTVVFACSVAHSKNIVAELEEQGIRAAHIDGGTSVEERDRALADLADGRIEVVSNAMVLVEGWDLPLLDAVILARATKSMCFFIQATGRVLRPHPAKKRALILDHGGNVMRLGWPTAAREWDINDGLKKKRDGGDAGESVRNCPSCGAVSPNSVDECPACGFVWERKAAGEQGSFDTDKTTMLREITAADAPPPAQGAALNALCRWVAIAKLRGMKVQRNGFPGFAAHRFKEKFNRWPTADEMITSLERTRRVVAREAKTDE